MKSNVGGIDRVLRILAGLALLSLIILLDGPYRWLGLIGIVPLVTGLARWCPLYPLMGLSTCPIQRNTKS
jgi:hypothetical protein